MACEAKPKRSGDGNGCAGSSIQATAAQLSAHIHQALADNAPPAGEPLDTQPAWKHETALIWGSTHLHEELAGAVRGAHQGAGGHVAEAHFLLPKPPPAKRGQVAVWGV